MSDILSELGLYEDDFSWYDLAACKGMPVERLNDFFDEYEEKDNVAINVDKMCFSCPVINQCLRAGLEGEETGVWGGVYLTEGQMDAKINRHKTDKVWDEWRSIVESE